MLTLLTSAEEPDFAQKGRVESQGAALEGWLEGARLKRRQSLGRERLSGSGLDVREVWGNAGRKN